jgi:hypothetical protein
LGRSTGRSGTTTNRHYCHRYVLGLERLWNSGAMADEPFGRSHRRDGMTAQQQGRDLS